MNLNQSAHGGREFGFICSRLRQNRKVIVGHWEDPAVQQRLATWLRAAAAWHDWQSAKIARIGDNMREVAVTEGDKVAAQIQLGYAVNGYGIGDLVRYVDAVSPADIKQLCAAYDEQYAMAPVLTPSGGDSGQRWRRRHALNWGCAQFLESGGFAGFTDTFEDLHGLRQLPGIAVQRLMADGYGYGAEGDWKHAALVRAMKVMSSGLAGGVSFMEDYTYHFDPTGDKVLGAHMLEICPSIAAGQPSCEIHPLGIGGKEDPVRLVFDASQRSGDQRVAGGHGQSISDGRQPGGRGAARSAVAQAARGPRDVGAATRPRHGRRRLDPGRRRTSHQLRPVRHVRAHDRLCGDGEHRSRDDRRRQRGCRTSRTNFVGTKSTIIWRMDSRHNALVSLRPLGRVSRHFWAAGRGGRHVQRGGSER